MVLVWRNLMRLNIDKILGGLRLYRSVTQPALQQISRLGVKAANPGVPLG